MSAGFVQGNSVVDLLLDDSAETPLLELGRFEGQRSAIESLAVSPDGRRLAAGSAQPLGFDGRGGDQPIRLWNVDSRLEESDIPGHCGCVASLAFTADGRRLLSGSFDQTARLWDVATGRELRTLRGHTERIRAVAISPDGRLGATAGNDQAILVHDLTTGQTIRRFQGHTHWITSLAFSPDGKTILSAAYDRTLRLWAVPGGAGSWWTRLLQRDDGSRGVLTGHGRSINSAVFSPDGRWILSGSSDQTVRVWCVETGVEACCLNGHSLGVTSVAISRDGRWAASAGLDETIRLWSLPEGRAVACYYGHEDVATAVTFLPDMSGLVSASADHTIRLWRMPE